MKRAARDALVGFGVGAALGAIGHVWALVASAEGAPHDEATRRVSVELARLAAGNARFAIALTLAVMVASGLVGAAVALLWRWAAPSLGRGRTWLVAAGTALALGLAVVRAFLWQPALLEPSLGGAHGALAPLLAKLAASAGPRAVDGAALAVVLFAAAAGLAARRRAIRDFFRRDTERRRAGDATERATDPATERATHPAAERATEPASDPIDERAAERRSKPTTDAATDRAASSDEKRGAGDATTARRGGLVSMRAAVRRHPVLAAAVLLAAVAAGVTARPRRARAPRLLILAADSLRPDRLDERTAPVLSALARRGVRFDAALSPIARTTPSWISILTGLYPQSHGVRDMFPRRELRPAWLDYLPRRLHDAGFRTALVTDYAGDFFPLFDVGFERARVPPTLTLPLVFEREVASRSPLVLALLNDRVGRALFPVLRYLMTNSDPERLADEALDELDAAPRSDDRPTALVVFFSTTHVPFAAPAPYYRRFGSPGYGGPHRYAYDAQRLADVTASDAALPDADVAQIRALYDGSLAAVDAAAGRLLARASDDTLVVLLSDHGENLFEPGTTTHHGKWFKGGDESIRVPLVFAGGGVPAGARVGDPVSLVDVAPTVSELLRLPAVPADGRSLVPAFHGALAPRDVLVETGLWLNGPAELDGVRYPALPELLEADARDRFQLVLKARYEDVVVEAKHRLLRRGPLELVYLPTADGVRWQLYDTLADPHHEHDLAGTSSERPALERAMLKLLARDPERELDARDHVVRRTED